MSTNGNPVCDPGKNNVLIPIEKRLEQINKADNELRSRHSFVIIGAGVSGLSAAYELTKRGHRVMIFEASTRIGGRILTQRLGPPVGENGEDKRPYVELGAMRIPVSHDYTLYYAREVLNLRLRRFLNIDYCGNNFYRLRGVTGQVKNFSETFIDGADPVYKLTDAEKEIVRADGPSGLMADAIRKIMKALSDEELECLNQGQLATDKLRDLDRISLRDVFAFGKPDWPGLDITPLSSEALELLGAASAMADLWDRSLTVFIRFQRNNDSSKLYEIDGGMDRLTEGLRKAVLESGRATIVPNRELQSMELLPPNANGIRQVRITINGSAQTLAHVICTVPYSVLRRFPIKGFSNQKLEAIRNMSYASSAKVGVYCTQRFWQIHNGIYGGRSATDQVSRQMYYPADQIQNSPCAPAGAENDTLQVVNTYDVQQTRERILRGESWDIHIEPFRSYPETNEATPAAEQNPGPGVLLTSYVWGNAAVSLSGQPRTDRVQTTIRDIAEFQPLITRFADPTQGASMNWDEYRWACGAFALMLPGELTSYYDAALRSEGGAYFCGDHLSPIPGWIQGSMSSTLYNVENLLKYLKELQDKGYDASQEIEPDLLAPVGETNGSAEIAA